VTKVAKEQHDVLAGNHPGNHHTLTEWTTKHQENPEQPCIYKVNATQKALRVTGS
jgi:hypothetical protein